MWDTTTVSALSGGVLSREDVLGIITHYDSLDKKFAGVRS